MLGLGPVSGARKSYEVDSIDLAIVSNVTRRLALESHICHRHWGGHELLRAVTRTMTVMQIALYIWCNQATVMTELSDDFVPAKA